MPAMRDPELPRPLPDVLTVVSVAVVAYALSNVAHEGFGHGGACLLVGCSPHLLTSMQFDGDSAQLPEAAARLIAAGGSVTFSVQATGSGVTYQWRRNGEAIPGATNPTLTIANVQGGSDTPAGWAQVLVADRQLQDRSVGVEFDVHDRCLGVLGGVGQRL